MQQSAEPLLPVVNASGQIVGLLGLGQLAELSAAATRLWWVARGTRIDLPEEVESKSRLLAPAENIIFPALDSIGRHCCY
jgi:hypothetical protein